MESSIKNITISNFKSFKYLELRLQDLNVLIGGNASGKTNLVHALKFLRDISNDGLQSAISEQGGIRYLRNINLGFSHSTEFYVTFEFKHVPDQYIVNPDLAKLIKFISMDCKFSLKFFEGHSERYEIEQDQIEIRCKLLTVDEPKNGGYPDRWRLIYGSRERVNFRKVENRRIKITLKEKNPKSNRRDGYDFSSDIEDENLYSIFRSWALSLPFRNGDVLLRSINHMPIVNFQLDVPIFNFDSRQIKGGSSVRGKSKLENNGENLALIVKNILSHEDQAKDLQTMMAYVLPFMKGINVKGSLAEELLLEIKEKYSPLEYFPSRLMSDGTINVTAMLVALQFDNRNSTIVLEEPERNLHPHLIGKVVSIMADVSRQRQVVVTTHHPEVIRHAGQGNIFLVGRDDNGFSIITKPAEKEEVKEFLKNDIGLADLYIQDLLKL